MKALIGSNNRVIDVRPDGEEFPAPNPWVDAPPDVAVGWMCAPDGGGFTEPAAPAPEPKALPLASRLRGLFGA